MDPKYNLQLPTGIENFEKLYEVEGIVQYRERDAAIVSKIKEKCSALPPSNREDEIVYLALCLYDRFVGKVPMDEMNLFISCAVCISWSSNKQDKVGLPPRFQELLNTGAEVEQDVSVADGVVWKNLVEEMKSGVPVSPFNYLNFLYPMVHLPRDRKPVNELLAKSREDRGFSVFVPSVLAVSAVLAYASRGGFGQTVRNNFMDQVKKFRYFDSEERKNAIEKCTYEMETLYEKLHPGRDQLGCCHCTLQ